MPLTFVHCCHHHHHHHCHDGSSNAEISSNNSDDNNNNDNERRHLLILPCRCSWHKRGQAALARICAFSGNSKNWYCGYFSSSLDRRLSESQARITWLVLVLVVWCCCSMINVEEAPFISLATAFSTPRRCLLGQRRVQNDPLVSARNSLIDSIRTQHKLLQQKQQQQLSQIQQSAHKRHRVCRSRSSNMDHLFGQSGESFRRHHHNNNNNQTNVLPDTWNGTDLMVDCNIAINGLSASASSVLMRPNGGEIDQEDSSQRVFEKRISDIEKFLLGASYSTLPQPYLQLVNKHEIQYTKSREINSLVFEVMRISNSIQRAAITDRLSPSQPYVLAIVDAMDRVNVTALEQFVLQDGCVESNEGGPILRLASTDRLVELCGFAAGSIPPVGLHFEPLVTVVESSLISANMQDVGTDPNAPLQQPTSSVEELHFSDDVVDNHDHANTLYVGGGGKHDRSCLVNSAALLHPWPGRSPVLTRSFRYDADSSVHDNVVSQQPEQASVALMPPKFLLPPNMITSKPFFAVAAPSDKLVQQILEQTTQRHQPGGLLPSQPLPTDVLDSPLRPTWVHTVGRVASVRRMARRLVFCDLAPPGGTLNLDLHRDVIWQPLDECATTPPASHTTTSEIHPWLCPDTRKEMAVQLIAGKTLCQRLGDIVGTAAIRALKVGQLICVQGFTNVQNLDSLDNWISNQSLDIVVYDYRILEESVDNNKSNWDTAPVDVNVSIHPVSHSSVLLSNAVATFKAVNGSQKQQRQPTPREAPTPGMDYLTMEDLYGNAGLDGNDGRHVMVVDDEESVRSFDADLSDLLLQVSISQPQAMIGVPAIGLVGMDCEWLPTSLYAGSMSSQPVLLLQVCLHPLKRVYLLDLQSILRPLLPVSVPMNTLETAISATLSNLFLARSLVKTGFQLVQDLRRLAASYPHVPAFQQVYGVLEVCNLAKKVIAMARQPNVHTATASLKNLTERVLKRTLDKQEQCSNWSYRPLSQEQRDYAALDAAVTPALVERLMEIVDARFYDTPHIGRTEDDNSFQGLITSWHFHFLEATIDARAAKKLQAKRVIGDAFIVTQSWISGRHQPALPSLGSNDFGVDGSFTNRLGMLCIPSRSIVIDPDTFAKVLKSMGGEEIGKSKEKCVSRLVKSSCASSLPDGAVLEFSPRSGYVELENAVVLFVNMPTRPGLGRSRSYPNEWMEDGQILTWYLRENDWEDGTSPLAKKLTAVEQDDIDRAGRLDKDNASQGKSSQIALFVRHDKGNFICCGSCRAIVAHSHGNTVVAESDWSLIKLHLLLLDWKELWGKPSFRGMIRSGR